MSKVDWIIHYVLDSGPNGLRNFHTHGMEKYDHPDFQVALSLPIELVGYTLNTLGFRVSNGEKFQDGQIITDLFDGAEARLDKVAETGREVLRVIIPDPKFRWPEDPDCEEPYCFQTDRVFEDTGDVPCEKPYDNIVH